MIAACGGKSTIINPSTCQDAQVSMRIARFLGAKIVQSYKGSVEYWHIESLNPKIQGTKVNVGESGTVLRFLLPLLALHGAKIVVQGEGTLRGRPNLFLLETLRNMGVNIKGKGLQEGVPINISGGFLNGGKITIDGSLSSQFISALLIACPRLSQNTTLMLKGKTVSSDYITMTLQNS